METNLHYVIKEFYAFKTIEGDISHVFYVIGQLSLYKNPANLIGC